jgi:Fe-S cluster assembly scaffold protein SufB
MKVDLSKYEFSGHEGQEVEVLEQLGKSEKQSMKMAGFDAGEANRSASFLHIDHDQVFCKSYNPGVEILPVSLAVQLYEGLADYFWQLLKRDKDEFTRLAAERMHGGYFIRIRKGAKIEAPIQSCLMMHTNRVGQIIHNLILVEENAEAHILRAAPRQNPARQPLISGFRNTI